MKSSFHSCQGFRALVAVALICAFAATARPASTFAAETDVQDAATFVAGFEDLPLMPGLTQIPDDGVTFDTPSGRIFESYAKGIVTAEAVREFYARTLPQLGWHPASRDHFVREGEILGVETVPARASRGRPLTVHFSLAPRETVRPAAR